MSKTIEEILSPKPEARPRIQGQSWTDAGLREAKGEQDIWVSQVL